MIDFRKKISKIFLSVIKNIRKNSLMEFHAKIDKNIKLNAL